MKLFYLLVMVATPALACPDFSGHYYSEDEDEGIELTFTQKGCTSALGHYDYGSGGYINDRTMIFDGALRPLPDDGNYEMFEGFRWDGDVIRVESTYHARGSDSRYSTKGRIYFDSQKNLLEETIYFDENGKETQRNTYTYRRK